MSQININPQLNTPIVQRQERDEKAPIRSSSYTPKNHKPDLKLKSASLAFSATGIATAIYLIAKKQKVKIVEAKNFKEYCNPKNWCITKLNYEPMDVLKLAAGSVLGGLTGGLILDSENGHAKIREGIQQMLGNIIIPISFVAGSIKLLDKYKKDAKGSTKVLTTLGALGVGILTGNFTANKLNGFIFNKDKERPIKAGDFSGHLDDICIASTLIAPENKFAQIAGRFVPAALLVAGYEAGIKKNKE